MSKWLRESDGSECKMPNKGSRSDVQNFREGGFYGRNFRRNDSVYHIYNKDIVSRHLVNKEILPSHFIPNPSPAGIIEGMEIMGYGQHADMGIRDDDWAASDNRIMSMGQGDEQSLIHIVKGKKQQWSVGKMLQFEKHESDGNLNDKSACSTGQKS